jgi:hypothetical protein
MYINDWFKPIFRLFPTLLRKLNFLIPMVDVAFPVLLCTLILRRKKFGDLQLALSVMEAVNQTYVLLIAAENFQINASKNYFYISKINPTRCSKFSNLFYFLNKTLHVSDGLSVHHQESKTVHTATGICQIGTSVCLLVGTRWNCSGTQFHLVLASKQTEVPI